MCTDDYLIAFEKFLNIMRTMPDTITPDVSAAVDDLCDILRIGKIEVSFYDNITAELLDKDETTCYYDCGNYDESKFISQRNITTEINVAVYTAWLRNGAEEWSEDERKKILLILNMIFVFNGRSRAVKVAERLTFFDQDLNIHNMKFFLRFFNQLCEESRISGYAVVYFNLRRFSIVNRQVGRRNATIVMQKFVDMLKDMLDENEIICRIGSDNFSMVLKQEKLDNIIKLLKGTNIPIDNNNVFISASAGIYVIPDDENLPASTDVMDRVSLALHTARRSGRKNIVFFDEELSEFNKRNMAISSVFPYAIEHNEFLVYYQPKISLDGYRLAGAEALCRWKHDEKLILPADFIPILEHGMDICRLDFYMLDQVCKHIRHWLDTGKNVVKVSVNFSRRHLSDLSLLEQILDIIDRNNVPHEYIEIELTETTNSLEFKNLKRAIKGLQNAGISTSVDDFGIGHSSLNLIKEIPWNVLKLDKSLLPSNEDDNNHQKTVMFKYVVAMAQAMGLECIAEGVETPEQIEILKENSCNFAQGFYFDKPLPIEEFEARLDNFDYTHLLP
ncbi:MAG: GGDEF domain-containing protein [Ruminococcus sp.]|nr:GGDEF domain-containing protein [Ruminococcus sp.]